MDGVHDLLRGVARLGKFFGRDAPDAGNMLASRGIGERSLAGKLVALLPMLTAALAVALAGDHGGPGALASDISGGQSNVDHRQAILHAFGLVLQSASVHHDGPLRFADPVRGLLDGLRRHACHFSHSCADPTLGGLGHGLKAGGVLVDEFAILQAVTQDDVQHSHQQCEIGARTQWKIEIGVARDGSHARIGDDQLAALVAAAPDVVGGDGSAFADVRADHEQYLRFRDLAPWNWASIDAERQFVRRSGRDHAQSAVVVDVASAQRHAGELAHQIGFLGRERRAAVDGDGVLAILVLDLAHPADGEVQGLVPGRGTKSMVACASAGRADGRDGCPADSASRLLDKACRG